MASLQVQLIDENREVVHVDPVNHALLVTTADGGSSGAGGAWAIANGISFMSSLVTKVNPNQSLYYRVQTGANLIHAAFTVGTEHTGALTLSKDPTITTEVARDINNRNGDSILVSTATATRPTAVGASGTIRWQSLLESQDKATQLLILEPNSDYLIRYSNLSGLTSWTSINLDFYEPGLLP